MSDPNEPCNNCEDLQQEIEDLKQQNEKEYKTYIEWRKIAENERSLKEEFLKEKEELKKKQDEHWKELVGLSKENKELKEERQGLRKENVELNDELEDYKEMLKKKSEYAEGVARNAFKLEKENKNWKKQMNNMWNKTQALQQENKDLKEQVEEYYRQLTAQCLQIKSFVKENTDMKFEIKELKEHINELISNRVIMLPEQHASLINRYNDKVVMLNEVIRESNELKETIEECLCNKCNSKEEEENCMFFKWCKNKPKATELEEEKSCKNCDSECVTHPPVIYCGSWEPKKSTEQKEEKRDCDTCEFLLANLETQREICSECFRDKTYSNWKPKQNTEQKKRIKELIKELMKDDKALNELANDFINCRDTEQLRICPKAYECEDKTCEHMKPHKHIESCNIQGDCFVKCIPYKPEESKVSQDSPKIVPSKNTDKEEAEKHWNSSHCNDKLKYLTKVIGFSVETASKLKRNQFDFFGSKGQENYIKYWRENVKNKDTGKEGGMIDPRITAKKAAENLKRNHRIWSIDLGGKDKEQAANWWNKLEQNKQLELFEFYNPFYDCLPKKEQDEVLVYWKNNIKVSGK